MKTSGWLMVLTLGLANGAFAESVPFDDPRWAFNADSATVVEFAGRPALFLEGGRALLPDVQLKDGSIEFDVAFGPERGFSGVMFRFQRPGDFENFYLRPHQSGQPDASQYTPEVNGVSGWQLYYGPEFAAPFVYRHHEWMPVRIEFAGDRARMTVDGTVFNVPRLKRPVTAGAIGLRSGFAPAWFSNFRYSTETPDLPAADPTPRELPAGLVRSWRVSEAVDAGRLEQGIDTLRNDLQWQAMPVEPEGFVNLAWAQGAGDDHRTVLAELTLNGSGPQVVTFGYSDRVRVFHDGREIYRGDNTYRSRDHRYLGTIGLFDAVVVQPKAGASTVTFAVTEAFGGWGIMATMAPAAPR